MNRLNQYQLNVDTLIQSKSTILFQPLWEKAPPIGTVTEIAAGIWLLPLPLNSVPNHINVYLLEDTEGWALVDTGSNVSSCRKALNKVLNSAPINRLPISRVISTHFHPDHIGLAGWLCQGGVQLATSRASWMQTRLLTLENTLIPQPHERAFYKKAGMRGIEYEAYQRRPSTNYQQMVLPIPASYKRLADGVSIQIGNRNWLVRMGYGHAAEHVTLWSNDGYVITGDQVLPSISPNISVSPSEPDADVLGEWIQSCQYFSHLASNNQLCLPGHNIPFYGITRRCEQLIQTHQLVLKRLIEFLSKPRTVLDCVNMIYRRKLQDHERGLLIGETFAYLNHCYQKKIVERTLNLEDAYLWEIKN